MLRVWLGLVLAGGMAMLASAAESELLPPWYPTMAPKRLVNATWLAMLYPCSPTEMLWLKEQVASGEMTVDHAQHELGCRSSYRDPANTCRWEQLLWLKKHVLAGKVTVEAAQRYLGCDTVWRPPAVPTPAPPTPAQPTPAPPTPPPTGSPTPAPTPSDYKCIPDFKRKSNTSFNSEGRCCSEGATYFKWDSRYGGHVYCGVAASDSKTCVPDGHAVVEDVPCCADTTHKAMDAQLMVLEEVCGAKATAGLMTPTDMVDCRVTSWSCEALCSASCGGGTRSCTRKVVLSAKFGGAACPPLTKDGTCSAQPCPKDCAMETEHSCSECSKTCGAGTQICRRFVVAEPAFGGRACPTDDYTKSCMHHESCPVDCELTAWSSWSACTVTCGRGKIVRTRQVTTDAQHGGKSCGPLFKLASCGAHVEHVECPVDCVVGEWQPWTTCSQSCGGGTTSRTREILQPAVFGGVGCPVHDVSKTCNVHKCALPTCHADLAKCKVRKDGKGIRITHGALNQLGGFFHCHRVGAASCQFKMETGCSGVLNVPFNVEKTLKTPAQVTGVSDLDELEESVPDECRCVCNRHPCCKRQNFVLTNVELLGNTYRHVERWEDCCSLCTNHPGCGAWEYSDRKVCVLKYGAPTFMLNTNPDVVTFAGARAGGSCYNSPTSQVSAP